MITTLCYNVAMSENYQKHLEQVILEHQERGEIPSLFLHACCAPCSSYVLEYLSSYFDITVFFYNPNITDRKEYEKRVDELKRFLKEMKPARPVHLVEGSYRPEDFFAMAKGLEEVPERGERCRKCYQMRIEETARLAEENGFQYFCTTLSISPMKNAGWINEIGQAESRERTTIWLMSDFKKKGGYQRSIELSKEYELYRQNYCGCIFSKREAEKRQKQE